MDVHRLDDFVFERISGSDFAVNQSFSGKRKRGNDAQINAFVEPQIAHQSKIETGAPMGLNDFKGIGVYKTFVIANSILRKVESERQAKIIGFGVVLRHVQTHFLTTGRKAAKHNEQEGTNEKVCFDTHL